MESRPHLRTSDVREESANSLHVYQSHHNMRTRSPYRIRAALAATRLTNVPTDLRPNPQWKCTPPLQPHIIISTQSYGAEVPLCHDRNEIKDTPSCNPAIHKSGIKVRRVYSIMFSPLELYSSVEEGISTPSVLGGIAE